MDQILHNLAAATVGLTAVLYSLLVAASLDTLTGIWAAIKSKSLNLQYISEFIRSHVALKVGPIMLMLIAAVSVGGTDTLAGAALLTAATGSIAAYLATVVSSIQDNLSDGAAGTKGLPSSIVPTA